MSPFLRWLFCGVLCWIVLCIRSLWNKCIGGRFSRSWHRLRNRAILSDLYLLDLNRWRCSIYFRSKRWIRIRWLRLMYYSGFKRSNQTPKSFANSKGIEDDPKPLLVLPLENRSAISYFSQSVQARVRLLNLQLSPIAPRNPNDNIDVPSLWSNSTTTTLSIDIDLSTTSDDIFAHQSAYMESTELNPIDIDWPITRLRKTFVRPVLGMPLQLHRMTPFGDLSPSATEIGRERSQMEQRLNYRLDAAKLRHRP